MDGETTTPTTVQMSAQPPKRFSAESDFHLWFTRFELYANYQRLNG